MCTKSAYGLKHCCVNFIYTQNSSHVHQNSVHVLQQCAWTKTSSTKVAAGLERFVRLASNGMTIIISMRTTG